MAGLFEDANRAIVEAAYINVETTQTATAVTGAQPAPASPGDGINLHRSTRGIVFARAGAGGTLDVAVWVYLAAVGWVVLSEAGRSGIDDSGDSWKINTGGASRIYVQVTAVIGGAADTWFGRSYV